MKKNFKAITIMASALLLLTACAKNEAPANNKAENAKVETEQQASTGGTVTITDIHGEVEVKKNPQKVISLDNRTYDTLEAFGVKLLAAPKDVMPSDSSYVKDESVQDIGNHREPNLEVLAAADPELVIVGQRFGKYYEDIKKLVPNATVVDFNFDVSGKETNAGESLVSGFTDSTLALGEIFDKKAEAEKIVADFQDALAGAKEAYNGEKIMSVVVSGGEIGFSAPHSGRVWGPLYDIFEWTPALEIADSSSDHKGDDVSVEAIADSNPDYLLVLDRDAATSDAATSKPAKDVIENAEDLQNTNAIKNGKVVYAPNDTYTNESIQTFTELFNELKDVFSK